jgi:hypothetical protein
MSRKGIIVYSYDDLKRLHPENGTRGLWIFQGKFHSGHQKCAESAQKCDWVVGILFNNRAKVFEKLLGKNNIETFPVYESDIEYLKKYSDVGLILTGNYFPYQDYLKEIDNEFSEQFPIECLKEKGVLDDKDTYNSLFEAVATRYIIHGVYNLQFEYQGQGGKDRFRSVGYTDYVYDRWGLKLDLLDSQTDSYGNSISRTISGLPKHLKDRINKKLLLPDFENIEHVREHIKEIEGLKVINFYKMNGWVHATFSFDDYKAWTEGVRWK